MPSNRGFFVDFDFENYVTNSICRLDANFGKCASSVRWCENGGRALVDEFRAKALWLKGDGMWLAIDHAEDFFFRGSRIDGWNDGFGNLPFLFFPIDEEGIWDEVDTILSDDVDPVPNMEECVPQTPSCSSEHVPGDTSTASARDYFDHMDIENYVDNSICRLDDNSNNYSQDGRWYENGGQDLVDEFEARALCLKGDGIWLPLDQAEDFFRRGSEIDGWMDSYGSLPFQFIPIGRDDIRDEVDYILDRGEYAPKTPCGSPRFQPGGAYTAYAYMAYTGDSCDLAGCKTDRTGRNHDGSLNAGDGGHRQCGKWHVTGGQVFIDEDEAKSLYLKWKGMWLTPNQVEEFCKGGNEIGGWMVSYGFLPLMNLPNGAEEMPTGVG